MRVFISYAEEDADIASEIASRLDDAGFASWYYERDSVPGEPYLIQIGEAIDKAAVVMLIISTHSISSQQVTNEIIRAYEEGKVFIPILRDMTHAEAQKRQPLWRQALGAYTSIAIPSQGIDVIFPRIVAGIEKVTGTGSRQR